MYKLQTFLFLSITWLLCACTDPKPDNGSGRDYPTRETFGLIDRSMSYLNSDPSMAHRMLDSIADAGLMTRQRCDYFHAMVIFSGERKSDSALMICDRLLDAGRFGDDHFLEEELCVLASNITSGKNNHLGTLKYANRGIALCHGDERMRGDEVTLMARAGVAEQAMGRVEQARETFDRAYQMLKGTSTFSDLVALITLQKRQISLYRETKEYDILINTCHKILSLVDRFERDPSFVEQRPETMQEAGPATKDFADFYRCQIYEHLARTFRQRIEQGQADDVVAETDSVRIYVDKLLHNEGVQASTAQINALHEIQFLGLKAEFDHIRPQAEELYRNDTLVDGYIDYLKLLANDAAASHNLQACCNYQNRALAVSDSIYQREQVRMLTEQMSINMVQEQQLARQDAESQLERQKLMILLLTVVLITILIAGLAVGLLLYNNRKKEEIIKITQQDLDETEEEVKELTRELEETKAEKTSDNSQVLYERIEKVMEEKKLYLDADLNIKMVAEAACSSRPVISACINRISGKTFRQWLSEYRLDLFVKMLSQYPDTSIEELVVLCGYKDHSTFRRQFKEKYGMSALKYRKCMQDNSPSETSDSDNNNQ